MLLHGNLWYKSLLRRSVVPVNLFVSINMSDEHETHNVLASSREKSVTHVSFVYGCASQIHGSSCDELIACLGMRSKAGCSRIERKHGDGHSHIRRRGG